MSEHLTPEERAKWGGDTADWPRTPPLHVFRALMDEDDNTWWYAGSGHGLNAYEAAIDALDEAERERDAIRDERNHWIGEAKRYERLYRSRDEDAIRWFGQRNEAREALAHRERMENINAAEVVRLREALAGTDPTDTEGDDRD